jgi:hypothetical protein
MVTLRLVILLYVLANVLSQRSYTLNSVESFITLNGDCSATVGEIFELNFNGSYSNFYRSIQDRTTSDKHPVSITDFKVTALTDNVIVTKIYNIRTTNAVRLGTVFSSNTTTIGLTRFMFNYTVINFLSQNPRQNKFIWNNKWEVPVSILNTTVTYPWSVPNNSIECSPDWVSITPPRVCYIIINN